MAYVSELLDVERSSLFLYDETKDELWTPVAEGAGEIRVPKGAGIAANVFASGETVSIPDAYADPRFNQAIDRETGFRTRDIFCRPINDSAGRRVGVIQLLNRRSGPLTGRDEKLLEAVCGQLGLAIENAALFLRLSRVHESEHALHAQLEAKHAELRKAFLKIEEGMVAQNLLGRRVQTMKRVALLAGVGLFLAIGLFAWLGTGAGGDDRQGETPVALSWHTVATGPVRSSLALLGQIEPLEVVNLAAALRGRVAEKNFQYGELVRKGQLLARIDPTEVRVELRNAEAAHFKATAELARLERWVQGPEAARAKRNLQKAQLSFETAQRTLREMEQLLKLGAATQSAFDGATRQFANQETDLNAAREELATVIETATPDRITTARYDVENTRLIVDELKAQVAAAEIYAPFDGIVILPNARSAAGRANDGYFEPGSRIGQGEILLALGSLEGIAVKTRADEVDIARIRHDQPVQITGDAFPGRRLSGRVAYVSSQAYVTGAHPYFEVLVKTGKLATEDMRAVRLGMTARLDITVYEAEAATWVPVSAVRRTPAGDFVYRQSASGKPEAVNVEVGAATPGGLEIRGGVAAGDTIVGNVRAVSP